MIIKDKKVRQFFAKLVAGQKKKPWWINTDQDRVRPKIKTATIDNCPVGNAPPTKPLSKTVSVLTEYHTIIWPKGSMGNDFYLLGSADDSDGALKAQYPTSGLLGLKMLGCNFWGLCITPTWRDLIKLDMLGTVLLNSEGNHPFWKIREHDTYYADYYAILDEVV